MAGVGTDEETHIVEINEDDEDISIQPSLYELNEHNSQIQSEIQSVHMRKDSL